MLQLHSHQYRLYLGSYTYSCNEPSGQNDVKTEMADRSAQAFVLYTMSWKWSVFIWEWSRVAHKYLGLETTVCACKYAAGN